MLKFFKENSNLFFIIIISLFLIVIIILLDIYVFKLYTNGTLRYYEIGQNSNYLKQYSYIKQGKLTTDILDISNAFLEIMQNDNLSKTSNERQKILDNMDKDNSWRIIIPKISLNAPIQEGTTQEILAKSVGHFEESQYWDGNIALAGHNRGNTCNFFQNIKELEIGDKIIYMTDEGKREYRVIMNKIIRQTNWEYIGNTEDNRITLITCVENMYEYRRCIQAVEI